MSENLALIEEKIYIIRGQRVMLDADLAKVYEVETRVLNQAVKRNLAQFPEDFMFQLTEEETENLRNSSQFVMSLKKHRGASYRPLFAALKQLIQPPKAKQKDIGFIANTKKK